MKKLFVSVLATFMLLTGCSSSNTKTEEPGSLTPKNNKIFIKC